MLGLIDKVLSLFDNRKLACEVGYQHGNPALKSVLRQYAGQVTDVYFTLPGDPTYYGAWGMKGGMEWKELYASFIRDLDEIRGMGISAVVCVDASCYGANFASEQLMKHLAEMLRSISEHIRIRAVTTSSFPVAECLRHMNSSLKIRASEGMHLMSVRQLDVTQHLFNGYYIGNEGVRDLDEIERMRKWCDAHGKTLHLLANSGCLYQCPFHILHMSQTSHIKEISETDSIYENNRPSPCCDVYTYTEKQPMLLQNTWIRPEDLHKVSGYFETVKLASRISPTILDIVKGYCEGEWHGNLLKLFEMDYSILPFVPKIMNDKFPDGWFDQTMHCGHHCDSCGYCRKVFEQVAEKTDSMEKKEG